MMDISSLATMLSLLFLIMFVVIFVFHRFQSVKYIVKYWFMLIFIIFMSAVSLPFTIWRPADPGNMRFVAGIVRFFRLARLLGIDLEINNIEHLQEQKKPYVLAMNHQTTLDSVLLLLFCPNKISLMMKWSLQFVPVFGQASWLAGVTYIKRGNTSSAIQTVKDAVKRMKQLNTPLFVCPEGTRIQCDSMLPFKRGAFHLAVDGQIPIVPVVLSNYRNIFDKKNKYFGSGTVRVYCLPAISTEGLTSDDVAQLTTDCRQQMLDVLMADMESHKDEYKSMPPLKQHLR